MSSPIGWPGGKKNLVRRLVPLIPAHRVYIEPFCGSAKLLFAKPRSPVEIISDANSELINFFLVAAWRPSALASKFAQLIAHPELFRRLRVQETACEDEICKAFRFAYLTWFSFGSKGEHFAWPTRKSPQPHRALDLVRQTLQRAAHRLQHVAIEVSNYAEIIRKYDASDAFIYCDPPYVDFQRNGRYGSFSGEDLRTFFDVMAGIRGKLLISEEDAPVVRKLARDRGLLVRTINTTYTLAAGGKSKRAGELLISNYPLCISSRSTARLAGSQLCAGRRESAHDSIVTI